MSRQVDKAIERQYNFNEKNSRVNIGRFIADLDHIIHIVHLLLRLDAHRATRRCVCAIFNVMLNFFLNNFSRQKLTDVLTVNRFGYALLRVRCQLQTNKKYNVNHVRHDAAMFNDNDQRFINVR